MELRKISKSFGRVRAINETSFSVGKGEIFALTGPNGAGKMTLFNIITGNYKLTSEEVLLKEQRVDTFRPHKIVHCGIARTLQNIRLFSSMNALENVLIGFNNQMKCSILEALLYLGRFSRMESGFKDRVCMLSKRLELDNAAYHKVTGLSYGQQRKIEVAGAIVTNPSLPLLDGLAVGVNGTGSGTLVDLIFKLRKNYKVGILPIEYDIKFVNKLCGRVLVLDYGKTILKGKLSDTINHKETIAAYLGGFDVDC